MLSVKETSKLNSGQLRIQTEVFHNFEELKVLQRRTTSSCFVYRFSTNTGSIKCCHQGAPQAGVTHLRTRGQTVLFFQLHPRYPIIVIVCFASCFRTPHQNVYKYKYIKTTQLRSQPVSRNDYFSPPSQQVHDFIARTTDDCGAFRFFFSA